MVFRLPVIFCLLFVSALLPGNVAIAHEIRPAYLQLTEVGQEKPNYHILWKQPVVQNKRLPIDPVFSDECELSDLLPPEVTSVAILYNWQANCDLSETSIHVTGLMVNHTDVLVRVETMSDGVENYVLRPSNPTLDLTQGGAPALDYFIIGVDHLVFGVDHVLFVIGLFLFIQAPIALIKTITAFTISHSITLALSVLGLVKLDQGPIELVIALSILFLARELVQEESKRSRLTLGRPWVMAFLFGLLHGLGFAGALADIGLPKDDLWLSLLLFNLGIEAGQIAVIVVLAVMAWALSQMNWKQHFNKLAAWGMGSVAAFWTIDRALLLF